MSTKRKNPDSWEAAVREANQGPPFLREVLPDGQIEWRMSPGLTKVQDLLKLKLQRIENIADKEIQGAFMGLEFSAALARQLIQREEIDEAITDDDYFRDNPIKQSEANAMARFMIPLVHRLMISKPVGSAPPDSWDWLPHSKTAAEQLKVNARKWTEKVIDHLFPMFLLNPRKETQRAFDLIPLALEYCRKIDALPTREALVEWLCQNSNERFKLENPTDCSVMWNMSGLKGLKGQKPGKKVKASTEKRKSQKWPGVSFD